MTYRTVRTRAGLRMVQHGTVLSEIRKSPGPTHSVADVIASAVHVLVPESTVALLGFAGGGVLAPLRAMGASHRICAVDLDDSGYYVFHKLCSSWAGQVTFEKAEACEWLTNRSRQYRAIVEDLSVPLQKDVVKPDETWSELPGSIYRRLDQDGVGIFNLLRPTKFSWHSGFQRLIPEGFDARLVHFSEFENRLLIACRTLPTARQLSRHLGVSLRSINSRLAGRISVRSY